MRARTVPDPNADYRSYVRSTTCQDGRFRFDGLPDWLVAAQLDAAGADAATTAWLCFFDLMLGRYRQLTGPAVPLTLLVDKD